MPVAFPIYGFHVTKPIVIGSAVIRPRTSDHETAEGWSRDLNTYHLTGMLITETASDDFLFNFEAALSYIERLDVLIGKPLPFVDLDIFPQFEESLRMHKKKNGGGEMIGRDIFFPGSREKFLQLIIPKLNDQEFCESTQFNQLFFKCVEQFRQRKQFVEISYFLLFSGLETFARTVMKDHESTSAADPISKLLKSYDFDVSVNRPADLVRAISTYAHLRNSLFHLKDCRLAG